MKYEKPELVAVSTATNAIRGVLSKSGIKLDSDCHSGGDDRPSTCPFDQDE